MAPEEILSSADASRRDFIKKVLAGTTFAAPVIASFSMEGLSPENVWAQTCNPTSNQTIPFSSCANMTTSPCCAFAAEITTNIWRLGLNFIPGCRIITKFFLPTVEVQALFLGQLAEAMEDMTEGIAKGKGDCTKQSALVQFKQAAQVLGQFETLVISLCQGALADELICETNLVIGQITELVNGNCG